MGILCASLYYYLYSNNAVTTDPVCRTGVSGSLPDCTPGGKALSVCSDELIFMKLEPMALSAARRAGARRLSNLDEFLTRRKAVWERGWGKCWNVRGPKWQAVGSCKTICVMCTSHQIWEGSRDNDVVPCVVALWKLGRGRAFTHYMILYFLL
jgi:hypothetical protein